MTFLCSIVYLANSPIIDFQTGLHGQNGIVMPAVVQERLEETGHVFMARTPLLINHYVQLIMLRKDCAFMMMLNVNVCASVSFSVDSIILFDEFWRGTCCSSVLLASFLL